MATRRSFIKQSALTIAGASLLSKDLFASAKPATESLGVQLYSVRDDMKKDPLGTLKLVAKAGYKNVEHANYVDRKFYGYTPADFKKILNDLGLTMLSGHTVMGKQHWDEAKNDFSDSWKYTVEDAAAMGQQYVISPWLDDSLRKNYDDLKKYMEVFNKSGELCKKSGMKFGYHNHDFEFEKYENTLVYDHIITKTNPELVVMEMDLYWISKAGYDPVAYFNKYPGRFPLWHVKDMFAGTKEITEVGNGTINFDRIFAARETAGLKYWFVEQDVSKGNIFESLKASQVYLSKKDF